MAVPLDAQGRFVTGKHATWRSSNVDVVVVNDAGVVSAKALGSATVYGTIDDKTESANVVVVTAPPGDTVTTTPPTTTPPPTAAPVSVFNVTVTVDGPVAGTDTTHSQHVAGATVTVTRVMGVHGDTLNPSVLAGTITTDANGVGALQNLPGGYYTFVTTPPAGSAYVTSSAGIAPPTTSDARLRILLRRAP